MDAELAKKLVGGRGGMTADNENSLLHPVDQPSSKSARAARLGAEQQAEATMRKRANLLNLTHDAIFVCDMNGTVKYWNHGVVVFGEAHLCRILAAYTANSTNSERICR